MTRHKLLYILTILSSFYSVNAFAEVKILSTIRPIAYLVEGVNGGINDAVILVNGRISPHDYQPKPSDIVKIKNADIIFRIEDNFQPRFTKLLKLHGRKAKLVQLSKIDGLFLLPNEAHLKSEHEEDDHHHSPQAEAEESDHGHDHSKSAFDLHIWLSPQNAIKITENIAHTLTAIDPDNAGVYKTNAAIQIRQIEQLQRTITRQLLTYKTDLFFTYHDAFGYYTNQFSLNHSIAMTPTQNHQLSAKKMRDIIILAEDKNIGCIMLEPQFSDKLARVIKKTNPQVKIEYWDPLGFDLPINANSYNILIQNMTDNLIKCLS